MIRPERRTPGRRAISRGAAFVAAVFLGAGGLLLAGAIPASADTQGGSGGVGISVDIPGPTDTPTPTPTPTPTHEPGGGGSGDHGGGGSGGHGGSGDHGSGGHPGVDNGPLNISGLHAEYVPSINPFGGKVIAWFSVHNGSKTTITSKARFWLTGPVGNTVSDSGRITVPPIKPNATVRIQQVLDNVGQWTVLTAHATYLPPGSVDGITLKSAVRDVTIFAFPWLNAAGVTLGGTGVAIALVLRSTAAGLLVVRAI